jgi:hypothetical protein
LGEGPGDGYGHEEVISGNMRTFTCNYLSDYTEVVNGNTITRTETNGDTVVVDKQGNDIFITLTGSYPSTYGIGVSEKDHVKNVIDGITSGRMKDGLFYELITYFR